MSDCQPATESAFAARLASHISGPEVVPTLIGEGSNNRVYRLDDTRVLKLGKLHRLGFAAAEHAKEMWCAARDGRRYLDVCLRHEQWADSFVHQS